MACIALFSQVWSSTLKETILLSQAEEMYGARPGNHPTGMSVGFSIIHTSALP